MHPRGAHSICPIYSFIRITPLARTRDALVVCHVCRLAARAAFFALLGYANIDTRMRATLVAVYPSGRFQSLNTLSLSAPSSVVRPYQARR